MLKLTLIFAANLLAAPPVPGDAEAYNTAKEHFNEGRYLQAAAGFEQLWEQSPKPKYLHYAAMAWAAQGRDTHAIVNWQRVVDSPDASPKLHASASEFLVEAYKRAPAVTIEIRATSNEPWVIELTPEDGPPITQLLAALQRPGVSPPTLHLSPGKWTINVQGQQNFQPASTTIDVKKGVSTTFELAPEPVSAAVTINIHPKVQGATAVFSDVAQKQPTVNHTLANGPTVNITPGTWTVTVDAPGHHPQTRRMTLQAGTPQTVALQLQRIGPDPGPKPPPAVEQPQRVPHPKLALGLGIGAGVAVAAGGVLVGVGEGQIPRGQMLYDTGDLQVHADQFAVGSLFLGGGAGLGVTAILARVGIPKKHWKYPLLAGMLTAVGGGTWYAVTASREIRDFWTEEDFDAGYMRTLRTNAYGSRILTGLGVGLLVGSVASLAKLRSSSRKRLSVRGMSLEVFF